MSLFSYIYLIFYWLADPDLTSGDGIYSLYLSNYYDGPGTYKISFTAKNTDKTAFVLNRHNLESDRCCGSFVNFQEDTKNYISIFERRIEGSIFTVTQTSQEDIFPPAKIGDLKINQASNSGDDRVIIAHWTATG